MMPEQQERDQPVIVTLDSELMTPEKFEGRLFQVHVLPYGRLQLYPVRLEPPDTRCPVVIGGERCGCRAGHEGKHMWANGD